MRLHFSRYAVIVKFFIPMITPVPTVAVSTVTSGSPIEALAPVAIIDSLPLRTTPLNDRMKELKIPGFSITVLRNGKIDWSESYGEGFTNNTLYQAGSISKPLTAMAVMHLVQKGTIDLDADVNRYLKSWKIPKTPFNTQMPVTVRMLLNHTAGLTRGAKLFPKGEPVPTLVELLAGKKPAGAAAVTLDNDAGKDFLYSDNNYAVLQLLLEELTGKPFADFMKATVFSPLGMTNSRYEQPLSAPFLSRAARPFDHYGKWSEDGPYTIGILASGGLWTTASDLALFAVHIQDILAGRSDLIVSRKTMLQMLEPGKGDYGLGFFIRGKGSASYFTHGGTTNGYQCELLSFQKGDGVVIMTSSDNGFTLIDDIVRTLARVYGWPGLCPLKVPKGVKADPASLGGLVGTYRYNPHLTFRISREQNRLFFRFLEQEKAELFPYGNDSFYLNVAPTFFVPAQFDFIRGAGGSATKVILHQGGGNDTAPRVASVALAGPQPGITSDPVRFFFDPRRKCNLNAVFIDTGHGASATLTGKGDTLEWRFTSGYGWGCGFTIPCNIAPLGDSATVDLRRYRYLCFDALLDHGKCFQVHVNEYRSAAGGPGNCFGVNGSDAESFIFESQSGRGAWSPYRLDLKELDLRTFWGNQNGNRICDLQSISSLDIQIPGGQGNGKMAIRRVRFEKE